MKRSVYAKGPNGRFCRTTPISSPSPKPKQPGTAAVISFLALFCPFLFAPTLHASPAVQAWEHRYPGASGAKIAVDPDGNVIVAAQAGSRGLIFKYSGRGVALWTNTWGGGAGLYVVQGMALDDSGNVYVTGNGTTFVKSPDNYFTTAYSKAGTPLWTNLYNGTANLTDRATGVAVDGAHNVFVTGYSDIPNFDVDYVTISYTTTGIPRWTNSFPAFWMGYPAAVAVDQLGHVYVSGTIGYGEGAPGSLTLAYSSVGELLWAHVNESGYTTQGIAVDGGGNVFLAGESASSGAITFAYASGGGMLWSRGFSGWPNRGRANAITLATTGIVYVTGYSSTNTGSASDWLTLGYSSAGTLLWTNRYHGPTNNSDSAQALVVGTGGTVYVTGYSGGTNGYYNYLTIAYSSNGVALWTNRYCRPGDSQASALALDRDDNLYITGVSGGDCVTIKYAPAPDIRFSKIQLLRRGACRLTIAAPTNIAFRLEASTNLTDWRTLTNYSNLPVTPINYTDGPAHGSKGRFYRAVWSL